MKKNNVLFRLVVLVLIGGMFSAGWALYAPPRTRKIQNINKNWKFIKQDVANAQSVGFNDAAWSSVHLPHSFDQPYWRANMAVPPYVGWYRRHIELDSAILPAQKRVFIEFEAVFLVSSVYVNGTLVGTHKGGYTGFSYDITANLHAGDNVVAVRVDASWNGQVAPRAGEHIFCGGIYRDVELVVTDALHVPWYGTFVYTPGASAASATVNVNTEVRNNAQSAKSCRVRTIVYDSSRTAVLTMDATQSLAAGTMDTFVQTGSIPNPRMWSPSTPYRYTVYTEVYDAAVKVDDFVSPFGVRTVRWDKDNGFFLNGQHLWLQGCNVHQDHAGWGDGTTNSGSYRDVKMIKECGMNFIRGSHYPHDPAFSDACDTYGMTLWSEMCFWGFPNNMGGQPWNASSYPTNQADQAPFEQNVIAQLKEMIRIHRNHPSVIIWSMSNEVEFIDATVAEKARALLRSMIQVAHTEDISRRAAVGGAWGAEWVTIGDVNGYNGGEAWISTPPGFPTMQTEYGSCVEWRPGGYNGCYGSLVLQNGLPVKYPWRSGISIWCGFHHGSNVNTGEMGMIDHARLPLRRYYYYRNLYAGIAPPIWPVAGSGAKLTLTADTTTITDDGRSDCHLIVQVQDASGRWVSGMPNITLTDKSGIGMFPTGTSITFTGEAKEKGVLEGMAAIEYRSYKAGTATIEATSGNLTPSSVTITVLHVPEDPVTVTQGAGVSHAIAAPQELVIAGYGSRIVLPGNIAGKKVAVTLFDLRGRVIDRLPPGHAETIVRRGATEGIVITKIKVVE